MIEEKVLAEIEKAVPAEFYKKVLRRKNVLGTGEFLQIVVAPVDYHINDVRGQRPQVVSFALDLADLELRPQIYGGCGGRSITVKPPEDSHLYCERVHIPFRTPKRAEKNILAALNRFFARYVAELRKQGSNLMHYDKIAHVIK